MFSKYIKEALCRTPLTNYQDLTYHRQLHLEVINKNSDKDWNWHKLHRNVNFEWNWVLSFPDKNWDWQRLSRNEKFTFQWVRDLPDKNWDWHHISRDMKIEEINEFKTKNLDWSYITMSDDISVSMMVKYQHLPWLIHDLFFRTIENSEIEFLKVFKDVYSVFDWEDHTQHADWDIIKHNMDLPWCKHLIHVNNYEDGDIDIIKHNPGDWNMLLLSNIVPVDIIIENPHLEWDFYHSVSLNKSLSVQHVTEHPELNWNYTLVPVDPEIKRWFAANIIKRYWKRAITDPERELCKKILKQKFKEDLICLHLHLHHQ